MGNKSTSLFYSEVFLFFKSFCKWSQLVAFLGTFWPESQCGLIYFDTVNPAAAGLINKHNHRDAALV